MPEDCGGAWDGSFAIFGSPPGSWTPSGLIMCTMQWETRRRLEVVSTFPALTIMDWTATAGGQSWLATATVEWSSVAALP